jgi:predicted  nucleic acid-binding Zn-ribbon protein
VTKVVELRAENVKRLRAVELHLGDGVNVVAGRNGQGKTSVLDSLEMALGGKSSIPRKPVRKGEDKASIVVRLDNGITITRHIKPDGTGTLKVTSPENAAYASPQALLDGMLGSLSFDPLAFSRMDGDDQYETLRRLMGVDTSDLDAEHAKIFAQRTDVNREAKRLEVEHAGLQWYEDVPEALVSVESLAAELEAAQGRAQSVVDCEAEARRAEAAAESERAAYARVNTGAVRKRTQITQLRQQIEQLEADIRDDEAELERIKLAGAEKAEESKVLSARAEELRANVPDIEEIRMRIKRVEATNGKVRSNERRNALAISIKTERSRSSQMTDRLAEIDAERAARIEAAPIPMPGLALGDGIVTLNGLPFDQASGAEQLRASVAIGIALNPKLRLLLVRDGSLLDRDGLRLLGELAAEHDCQVLLERVDTVDGVGVVIEDGSVLGAEVDHAAAE